MFCCFYLTRGELNKTTEALIWALKCKFQHIYFIIFSPTQGIICLTFGPLAGSEMSVWKQHIMYAPWGKDSLQPL